jgi:hypothetical protein
MNVPLWPWDDPSLQRDVSENGAGRSQQNLSAATIRRESHN